MKRGCRSQSHRIRAGPMCASPPTSTALSASPWLSKWHVNGIKGEQGLQGDREWEAVGFGSPQGFPK